MEPGTFVHDGVIFTVEKEEDGKYVVDINITGLRYPPQGVGDWARVVGRFDSLDDAITSAKHECNLLTCDEE